MHKAIITIGLAALALTSCGNYAAVQKSSDYGLKYEVAKQYFFEGKNQQASYLLSEVVTLLKGSDRGEECLYLLGLSSLRAKDYEAASTYFKKYYETYPRGLYTEEARYQSGMALYLSTPEPKLDQTATYEALQEFQGFIEQYPASHLRRQAQERIFELQDKLVEKEYLNAKLYYTLGSYIGNGSNGNYQACITTAENAIKDYPYSKRREDFAMLIVKAKFDYAKNSVASKQEERYAQAIEEYYGFRSEFPESRHLKEAAKLYDHTPEQFKTGER